MEINRGVDERDDAHANTLLPIVADTGHALKPGDVVAGRYRILRILGQGGMGAVFEALQLGIERSVAVKTLIPGLGLIPEIGRRFEREAKATSLLEHEHIVKVLDFGKLPDGALYLVMEYVPGHSLADLIDGGPVAPARAVAIMRQVLEALAHAHSRGIIHRDLKPDNVMLRDLADTSEQSDDIKLFDFGIARVVGEAEQAIGGEKLTQAGITFGTPEYMAPEQALGAAVDARADLYSAGCILYELLTGKKPFDLPDKMAVLQAKISRDPPSPGEVLPDLELAKELDAVVMRALARQAADRFASASDMLAALDGLPIVTSVAPEPPIALSVAAPVVAIAAETVRRAPVEDILAQARARRVSRRRPFIIGAAIGAVVLVVAIIVSVTASDGRKASSRSASTGERWSPLPAVVGSQASPEQTARAREHLERGHDHMRTGRRREAIEAYRQAVDLAPTLGADATLLDHLSSLVDASDSAAVVRALELAAATRQDRADDLLAEKASRAKSMTVRQRARELAADRDIEDRVDLLDSYALDLRQGRRCEDRREAVNQLRALKDKAAIPHLKRARGKRGTRYLVMTTQPNACLERDAADAIRYLEEL